MNQMYEQKYLKYKQKYLELKNNMNGSRCSLCGAMNGSGCSLCGSMNGNGCSLCGAMNGGGCSSCGGMRGGVILKNFNYGRTEVILPESFDIGNIVSFVGELSFKDKLVGKAIIIYYISDVLDAEYRSRSLTRGTSLQPELASASTGSVPVAPLSTEPTHTVKIDVTIILFDMTVYKFSNDNVPIRLVADANRTLAPYNVNTTLNLKRNTNAEKDLTMTYVIDSGKGNFTINP